MRRLTGVMAGWALVAVVAMAFAAAPGNASDKQAAHDEMIAIAAEIRQLKPQAGEPGVAAQIATLRARYEQLSAQLGGFDPAATLGQEAVAAAPLVAPAPPPGCAAITVNAANNTPVAIPDGPGGQVQSQVTVAGAGAYLFDLDLTTFITHTWNADLRITLQSPAGSIVTITTNNGGSNDNVFNGTLWDDQANDPATDKTYANNVVATPLTPEGMLQQFIGQNPNGTWTLTIQDTAAADVGTLNSWSLDVTSFAAPPAVLSTVLNNNTPVAIVDNTTVQSTINAAGVDTYLLQTRLTTAITHTWNADLNVRLISPGGTTEAVTTGNGGSNDNVFNGTLWTDNTAATPPSDFVYVNNVVATPLTFEGSSGVYTGQDPNGTWTLSVQDTATGDVGTINSWSLELITATCGCQIDLTCPGNVTATAPPGALSTTVNFPAPTVGGTCASVTVECVPASGDAFPVGDTTVVCTAIDAATQTQAACTFNVAVNDRLIQDIPTASTVGLAALALLLAGAAFVALRRAGA